MAVNTQWTSWAKHRTTLRNLLVSSAIAFCPGWAIANDDQPPLELHPTQLGKLIETANALHKGAFQFNLGTAQTSPTRGTGTGNQVYYLGIDYALTDRLTFGIHADTHEDPPIQSISGALPAIGVDTVSASAKYLVIDGAALDVAVMASAEFYRFESPIFGSQAGSESDHFIGSVKAPISYAFSEQLQFHLTPGVSILPDTMNGNTFHGILPHVGVGASYRPSHRLAFFAGVDVPFAGNGNTITSSSGISNVPVWTAGSRYTFTPKGALELYATNGAGTTPATSILSYWPDGNEVLFGARLIWTPGNSARYSPSYRDLRPLTQRELNLQQDGFTLMSGETFEPGSIVGMGWGGTSGAFGAGAVFAPDQDGQFEFYGQRLSDDGSVPAGLKPAEQDRFMLGLRFRFLDQNNGSPFTLSTRVMGGREIASGTPGVGILFLDAAASYKVNPRLAVVANPKAAAFGNNQIYGLGLGANYALFEGFNVIGEVTPTQSANGIVWAAGARYHIADTGFSLDASATNAVGNRGIGTLVAQDDVRFSIGVTKQLQIQRWW